jgi:hypothetical protein
MITQERLKELFYYHPESGDFIRIVRVAQRTHLGDHAGYLENGYLVFRVDGKKYKAHRLSWLYTHGTFPPDQIDHINGVKTDNRMVNLRPATNAENRRNCGAPAANTSGHKGVCWHKPTGKWYAQIQVGTGVPKYLGIFDDIEEAAATYQAAALKYHGEFAHA